MSSLAGFCSKANDGLPRSGNLVFSSGKLLLGAEHLREDRPLLQQHRLEVGVLDPQHPGFDVEVAAAAGHRGRRAAGDDLPAKRATVREPDSAGIALARIVGHDLVDFRLLGIQPHSEEFNTVKKCTARLL